MGRCAAQGHKLMICSAQRYSTYHQLQADRVTPWELKGMASSLPSLSLFTVFPWEAATVMGRVHPLGDFLPMKCLPSPHS